MHGIARLNRGIPAVLGSLLLLLLLLVACGEPVATPEPVFLQATGSTAMSPLLSELAAAFGESSPLIDLEVSGLGTQFGLETLRSGEADLALVSWLPAELDPGWRATAIARDAIAVIVHPSNPVDGLGLLQLQDLFGGRVYEWARVLGSARALGTLQPVSREAGSGTRAAFEALVMIEREVTPLAIVAPSSRAVIEYVVRDPHAIGYVSMGYVTSEVKVLKVEGELPTPQTAQQGSYPLTREFWLVTADPPLEAVQDFLDFVLGQAGQQIVGRRYGRIK
jgi:phosphate transport system substrate-binding protein